MTLFDLQRKLESELESITPSPTSEAQLLLEFVLNLTSSDLVLRRAETVAQQGIIKLERLLERRLSGEPVQYLLGQARFYGLELSVTPDVLIPRPETEILVELALKRLKGVKTPRILDVGTGSGAIALALKFERPDARVWASDISNKALEVARRNANILGLDVHFVESDVLESPELIKLLPDLDMLIANPPYLPRADKAEVAPEVTREPSTALFAGEEGLGIFRRLEPQAYAGLRRGAHCLIELDPRNVHRAAQLASAWQKCEILPDLNARERFLVLQR